MARALDTRCAITKLRAIVGSYVGVLLFSAFLFLGAGRLAYRQGWLYVGVALVGTTLNHLLVRRGSDILVERAARAGAGEGWDKRLLGLSFLASLGMFVTAGLDSGRFGWSGDVIAAVPVVGVVAMMGGQLLFALAKRENDFFSSTVRIQEERGHRVCDTGPYRWVRHPGYLGLLVSQLAFPLVLEAYRAFVPALVGAVLLVVRTRLEDRFLTARLEGYADFARRTRWRLVPGVW